MATTFKIKRFSAKTDAMKKAAEEVSFKELAPKGEKFIAKTKRVAGNVTRPVTTWARKNPRMAIGAAAGTALTGMAVTGGVKGYKGSKKEKTYSVPRQKIFFLDEAGNVITGDQLKAQQKLKGGSLKANLDNMKLEGGIKAEQQAAQRAANRAANKANSAGVAEAAKRAKNAGFKAGQSSVGFKQGAMNSWNKMGKMGKAGVIGAGVVGAGLMAKGLFGGKKD